MAKRSGRVTLAAIIGLRIVKKGNQRYVKVAVSQTSNAPATANAAMVAVMIAMEIASINSGPHKRPAFLFCSDKITPPKL